MRLLKSIQADLNQMPELGKDLSIVNGVLLAENLTILQKWVILN